MEGVVVLHETIHELHRKKQNGVIFKIDFEKSYDEVTCPTGPKDERFPGHVVSVDRIYHPRGACENQNK
jgi:hypothetical protein